MVSPCRAWNRARLMETLWKGHENKSSALPEVPDLGYPRFSRHWGPWLQWSQVGRAGAAGEAGGMESDP